MLPDCGDAEIVPSDEFDGPTMDPCRWDMTYQEDPDRYEVRVAEHQQPGLETRVATTFTEGLSGSDHGRDPFAPRLPGA